MIDVELVNRKLVLITSDLDELTRLMDSVDKLETADQKILELLSDESFIQAVLERLLERMITRMIDVNFHLLVASGNPPPPDYHRSFTKLSTLGVTDSAFATRLASAAGLRNRLVHEYDEIDPRMLRDAATVALADIPKYVTAVSRHLDREPGTE